MRHHTFILIAFVIFVGLGVGVFGPSLLPLSDPAALAANNSPQKVYHLSGAVWQVQGVSVGEGYQLITLPLGPTGTGTQCCCSYLPCILKKP